MLFCPYTDIHQVAEIAEKAFSVVSTKCDRSKGFFSIGCLIHCLVHSRPLSTLSTPKARIINAIKKDNETYLYYFSLFNSMWRISLWLAISCSRMCSGELGNDHFSSRRNIISLWNLLGFLFYITRKVCTELDFENFLK